MGIVKVSYSDVFRAFVFFLIYILVTFVLGCPTGSQSKLAAKMQTVSYLV